MSQAHERLLERLLQLTKTPIEIPVGEENLIVGPYRVESVPLLAARYIVVENEILKLKRIAALIENTTYGTFMQDESHQWGVGTLFAEHFFAPQSVRPAWFGDHGELLDGKVCVLAYHPHNDFDGEPALPHDPLFLDLIPHETRSRRRRRQ